MFDLIPFGSRFFSAYDPFREIEEMERRMFARTMPSMKTDIRETEGSYLLDAELPGFSKEEIKISIKDGVLTVRAEHKTESDEKDASGNYLRRERSQRSYVRRFDLTGIRAEEISAAYRDGVLTLTLPKESPWIFRGKPLRLKDKQRLKRGGVSSTTQRKPQVSKN